LVVVTDCGGIRACRGDLTRVVAELRLGNRGCCIHTGEIASNVPGAIAGE
jgi:hypothetical protein